MVKNCLIEIKSKRFRLTKHHKRLGVYICCIQETHLIARDYEGVLTRRSHLFSIYFVVTEGCFLASKSFMNATCSLVFTDSAGRLCVLNVTIKEKAF